MSHSPLLEPQSAIGEVRLGTVGLVRAVAPRGDRHVYAAGHAPSALVVGELGAMNREPDAHAVAGTIADGVVETAAYRYHRSRPSLRVALRWTLAPLRWPEAGAPASRARLSVARAAEARRALVRRNRGGRRARRSRALVGYLCRGPRDRGAPPFAAGP